MDITGFAVRVYGGWNDESWKLMYLRASRLIKGQRVRETPTQPSFPMRQGVQQIHKYFCPGSGAPTPYPPSTSPHPLIYPQTMTAFP